MSSSSCAAVAPSSCTGCPTVVSSTTEDISWSSMPTTEIRPGTGMPARRSERIAPMASSSYSATTAVGSRGPASSSFIACAPPSMP